MLVIIMYDVCFVKE